MIMEEARNSQEANESLDRMERYAPYADNGYPAQYVLINAERGSVMWYESHEAACKAAAEYGGSVLNTWTADPEYVELCLENARRNM